MGRLSPLLQVGFFTTVKYTTFKQESTITLNEITGIFNQAEVQTGGAGNLFYTFYSFENSDGTGRSATVVDPKNLHELTTMLEGYDFTEYAPGQIPVFVKRPVIQGT